MHPRRLSKDLPTPVRTTTYTCARLGTLHAPTPIMSRSRKSRRAAADRSATVDVVTQLEIAFRNPHAAAIGVIGGLIPWFGRTLAHEIPSTWAAGHHALSLAMLVVVLGCAAFSGLSVYKFGRAVFKDTRKAFGFVLALEGVMLVSHGLTSASALTVLILINAIANGSVIALDRDATCRKRAAVARASATRARSRARAVPVVETAPHSPAVDLGLVRWSPSHDVIDAEVLS